MVRYPLKETNISYPAPGVEEGGAHDVKSKQPVRSLTGTKESLQGKNNENSQSKSGNSNANANANANAKTNANTNATVQSTQQANAGNTGGGGGGHAIDTSIKEWQRQWKEIMTRSIFYFHELDNQSKAKVTPALVSLGATIQPFFDREVTIVISNSKTQPGDSNSMDALAIAKRHDMKIWSMEKLIRFLGNLGHVPSKLSVAPPKQELSHLLKEEKLLGHHSDRDPNAKREDYYYFKGPYILVWDPLHTHRPTLCREYTRTGPTDDDGDWPRMKLTEPGRCVFVVNDKETLKKQSLYNVLQQQWEHYFKAQNNGNASQTLGLPQSLNQNHFQNQNQNQNQNLNQDQLATPYRAGGDTGDFVKAYGEGEKRKIERVTEQDGITTARVENAQGQAEGQGQDQGNVDTISETARANKKIILHDVNGSATPTALTYNANTSATQAVVDTPTHLPFISGEPATPTTSLNGNTSYKFYDIAASGVSRSNTYTIASIAMSGDPGRHNGLAAPTAQVPSKEIANLKRKVLSRPYSLQMASNTSEVSTPHRTPISSRKQMTYANTVTPQRKNSALQAQSLEHSNDKEKEKEKEHRKENAKEKEKDSNQLDNGRSAVQDAQSARGVSKDPAAVSKQLHEAAEKADAKVKDSGVSASASDKSDKSKHKEKDSKEKESRLLRARKTPDYEKSRDNRGGYCENCRETFDRFIVHIQSAKHRNFANDPRNFAKLDDFLQRLKRD